MLVCKLCNSLSRHWIHPVTLGMCVLLIHSSARAAILANITAKIRNPGFSIVDNSGSVPLLPLDDSKTRGAVTIFGGPELSVESTLYANLSCSAIGVGGAWIGSSFVGVGSLRDATAGGHVDYNDEIQVLSSTLANGTPVEIQFSFAASNMVGLLHSFAGTNNNSKADLRFSAEISNQSTSANNINISAGDHRLLQEATFPLPLSVTGIMNSTAPPFDVIFDTTVGETINLHIRALANITGNVVSTGLGNLQMQAGAGFATLGIAFGAGPTVADVNLNSQAFGGEFPLPSQATTSNAAKALPVNTIWIPGDFDLDSDVDGADFIKWQRGKSPNPSSQIDLVDWYENYGLTAPPPPPALAAVPEPTTLLLLLGMAIILAGGRTLVSKLNFA